MKPATFSPRVRRMAVKAYLRGIPTREIAEGIGCSKSIVVRWCRRMGVAMRPASPPRASLPALTELERMRARFGSIRAVADVLGVSYAVVWRALNRGGNAS